MKIRVAPAALNDLKEIKAYIENDLSNPAAANNVIKRIIEDNFPCPKGQTYFIIYTAKICVFTAFSPFLRMLTKR